MKESIEKLIPLWSEAFLAMSSQKSATAVYSRESMGRELSTENELEIIRRNWEIQYDLEHEKRKRELQLQIEESEARLERLEEELRKRKLLKSQRKTNCNGKSVAKNESSVSREPLHVESFQDDLFFVEKPSFVKESLIAKRPFVDEELSQVLFAEPLNDVPLISSCVVVESTHTVIVEPIHVAESIYPVVEEPIEFVVELKRTVIVEPLHTIVVKPMRMECFSLVIKSMLSFVVERTLPIGLELTQPELVIDDLNNPKFYDGVIVHGMSEKLLLILVLQIANKWKSVRVNFYGFCYLDLLHGTMRLLGFLISRFWSSMMSLYLTVGSVTTF